jgi:hypothetical protein
MPELQIIGALQSNYVWVTRNRRNGTAETATISELERKPPCLVGQRDLFGHRP